MRKPNDIKAPDGFLLGGKRLVRKDGTILFQRGWWQAPKEWAGEYCWVHCTDSGIGDLEVAPPYYSNIYNGIYKAQSDDKTILCERTKRPDAKLGWRNPTKVAWANRKS